MPAAPRRLGRYELVTELARGGMAELHLGRLLGPAGFAKPLALKLILPHLSDEKQFVDMFLKEGRIAARLSHPNICQVFELGEVDGRLFLAMEYLEGVSWEELVRHLPDDARAAARATGGMVVQACEGLRYAHQLCDSDGTPTPVVHRDVSPQNLFVTRDGICKVLDFGVSKMAGDRSRTRSGVVKGKLPYMSPEQISAGDVDARADVFALGVVLWEGLTGERLFDRETDFLVWKAITEEDVPAPSSRVPGLHAELDAVVLRAVARDAAARFGSMSELAAAVTNALAPHGGVMSASELAALVASTCGPQLASRAKLVATAVAQEPSAATTLNDLPDPSATASMALRGQSVRLTRTRRTPIVVALVATALVIAVAAFALTRPASRTEQVAAAKPAGSATASIAIDAGVAVPDDAASVAAVADASVAKPPPTGTHATRRRDPVPVQAPPVAVDAGVEHPPPIIVPAGPGQLSVDVKPSAKVFLDGQYLDDTPVYRHEVPAGKHTLRLVRADRTEKTIEIKIETGKLLNLTTLAW